MSNINKILLGAIVVMVILLGCQIYLMGWLNGYEKSTWDSQKIKCEALQVSDLPAWCLEYLGVQK